MLFKKSITLKILSFGAFLCLVVFNGCMSHLEKGWSCYDQSEYSCAQEEFSKSNKPELAEKALAAEKIVGLYNEVKEAEKLIDHASMLIKSNTLIKQDRWDDKGWLKRTEGKEVDLMSCLAYAYDVRKKMAKYFREKAYNEKMKSLFIENLECGKNHFESEKYDKALACLRVAKRVADDNPKLKLDTDTAEYFSSATKQAITIQKAIEEEIRRAAEEKRVAEEQKLKKEKNKKELMRAKEKEAIKIAESKKKKQKELDQKWLMFLKKGRPLKPLVATVGVPSKGKGKIKIKGREKWQGGAQLPQPEDRSIQSEDIYSLGIEIPTGYRLSYLKNYKGKENLLSVPQVHGSKKFYYTEGYKGGRYYTELLRTKKGKTKYHVKATIYKIPVTN